MKPKRKSIKWNSDIAYIVGLITTDGCLSPDGRHIDLTSNDLQLLRTFKKILKINNKISPKLSGYTKKRSSYHIQFGDIIFYRWLQNIGLMPNKTKKIGSLKVPDKYFFDFLRGHLDGDGSISRYYDPVYKNSERLYLRFYSASLEHIKWIQTNIEKLLKIKGFKDGKLRGVYRLSYAKKDSLKILHKLYYSSPALPCLRRKYEKVRTIL